MLVYPRGVRKSVAFGSNPVIIDPIIIDSIKGKMPNLVGVPVSEGGGESRVLRSRTSLARHQL